MDSITCKQIQEYREVFEMFDKDKDGTINLSELNDALYLIFMGNNTNNNNTMINMSNSEINDSNSNFLTHEMGKKLLSDIDVDGNEKIDFEEFVVLIHKRCKNKQSDILKTDLEEAFRVFDKDGNGRISTEELLNVLMIINDKLTEEEINEILEEADIDKDGYINYVEFVEYVLNMK
jgi:calmodulin